MVPRFLSSHSQQRRQSSYQQSLRHHQQQKTDAGASFVDPMMPLLQPLFNGLAERATTTMPLVKHRFSLVGRQMPKDLRRLDEVERTIRALPYPMLSCLAVTVAIVASERQQQHLATGGIPTSEKGFQVENLKKKLLPLFAHSIFYSSHTPHTCFVLQFE